MTETYKCVLRFAEAFF